MLTLLLAYGAYRNAKEANQALNGPPNSAANVLLVSYGALLFFLWPLVLSAALIRYVPKANPLAVLLLPALPLLTLIPLGVEFYFVYSLVFLIIGLNFTITAFENIARDEQEESSQSS